MEIFWQCVIVFIVGLGLYLLWLVPAFGVIYFIIIALVVLLRMMGHYGTAIVLGAFFGFRDR
jgi:hypothetical protein